MAPLPLAFTLGCRPGLARRVLLVAVLICVLCAQALTALLAADVLWAPWSSAALLSVAAVVVLIASGSGKLQRDAAFFPIFALALSVAVPVLGLYLVFALLIAPALWTRRGFALHFAALGAVLACGVGLAASWLWDLPSGACVAASLCLSGMAAIFPKSNAISGACKSDG